MRERDGPGDADDRRPVVADGAAALARARAVAKWTDARYLDPILGLVLPGVGDAVGAAAGLYIVIIAVRHGVPHTVVARMLFNLAVDCVGGVVPLVGDLFDAMNRANLRNVRLLEPHLAADVAVGASGRPLRGRGKNLALSIAVLVLAAAAAVGVAYAIVRVVGQSVS